MQSGAIARSRARNGSSRGRAGVSTSIPRSSAHAPTGEGARGRPRPGGASGRVTTATVSWRDAAVAAGGGRATAGGAAKTRRLVGLPVEQAAGVRTDLHRRRVVRVVPRRRADLTHRLLAG